MCRFESDWEYAGAEQRNAHLFLKQKNVGSSPTVGTCLMILVFVSTPIRFLAGSG